MKKYLALPFLIFLFIFFTFLFADTTIVNTQETLNIILQVILPTLLPFLLLLYLFTEFGGVEIIAYLLQPITLPVLKISGEGMCVLLSGILGGSPIGSIMVSKLVDEKQIDVIEGQKLFNISGFVSLSFLSATLLSIAQNKSLVLLLIGAYYSSSLLILILSNYRYPCTSKPMTLETLKAKLRLRYQNLKIAHTIRQTIKSTVTNLTIISGSMVLFQLPFNLFQLLVDQQTAYLMSGFFEFSKSSILLLKSSTSSFIYLGVLCIVTSGGLSILIQNIGMMSSKLKITPYIITRVIHMVLASLIFLLLLPS